MSMSMLWPFGSYPSEPSNADEVSQPPDTAVSQEITMSTMLQHYDATTVPPPSARIDPYLKQQERQPLGLLDAWRYGLLVASKTTELAGEFVSHHIWGPRRKSWGIEMTMITTFMRNASKHSQLTDIATLRRLIGLAGFAPLPSDALVTPVTFRVRRHKLRGLLEEWGSAETGTRELSAEWVVGKRLWKRLQSEWKRAQGGKDKGPAERPRRLQKERVVLYLHGGAYYMFSAATHRLITIQLSKSIEARVFAVDYRLAPETRFPGQLHDAVCAYLRLIYDLHIPAENVLIAGDSAGGGLSLALLMYLRDNQYPLPAGAILMSPWVDLTMSCDSWDSNAPYDVVPMPAPGDHLNPVACYLGQAGMEKYLTHPYASPLFGEFKGLPPMLVQAGDAEVLRDEITLLAHKATMAGVEIRYELYEDAVHVFQTFPFLDTSRKAFSACREFVKSVLPLHQSHSPQMLDEVAEAGLQQEIHNEKARIVRGDGLEVGSGPDSLSLDASDTFIDGATKVPQEDNEDVGWTRHPSYSLSNGVETDETESSPTGAESSTIIRRLRSTFSLLSPQSPASPEDHTHAVAGQRKQYLSGGSQSRNHQRRSSGGQSRLSNLSMISSVVNPPPPTTRSRSRAISHPNISSLCQQWASAGPANRTTRYGAHVP